MRPAVEVGQRIELTHMGDDPHPIPVGSQGVVTFITEIAPGWQIGVRWDSGRTLNLCVPEDRFKVLT